MFLTAKIDPGSDRDQRIQQVQAIGSQYGVLFANRHWLQNPEVEVCIPDKDVETLTREWKALSYVKAIKDTTEK